MSFENRKLGLLCIFLILLAVTVTAQDACPAKEKGGDSCSSVTTTATHQSGYTIFSEDATKNFRGYTGTGGSCIWPPSFHSVTIDVGDINVSAIKSATLTVRAYDCDNPDLSGGCEGGPEIDTVFFNGEYIGILSGATDQWSTVSFDLDTTKILNGSNSAQVFIDTTGTGCWCLGVDWIELAVQIDDIDLKVNSSDLVLYQDWAHGYHMDATVHNLGSVDAENVNAKVIKTYLGSTMEEKIYSLGTITAGSSKNLRYDFVAVDLGNYQLQVIADPDGDIDETNENNNIGATHRVYGTVKDSGGTSLENIMVSLDQQSSPYTSKFKTVTDENGKYAIILNFVAILDGKQTQVNSTAEYSPDRDPTQTKLQVYDDSEWGSDFNPAANAKPYSKAEELGALNKERDYQKDITYPAHNALIAYKTLVKGYKYAKSHNIPVRQNIKIEVNNDDACECGAACPQTSCALAPIMTMWTTRSDKVDSMNHEYGHIASNENGVNNKYEPVEENWANYFSCKSRETSLYDYWGDIVDISNDEDTNGDNSISGAGGQAARALTWTDAGNVTHQINLWNFQLAGIYWDLNEASVISALKRSGLNTAQDVYNAYKITVGADNTTAKAIKRIFRNHGINAQAWAPVGYNASRRYMEAEGIRPLGYFTNSYSHATVDSNSDGFYDILNIRVEVNVSQSGGYYLMGFLSSANGTDSCFASNYSDLSAGLRNVTLRFLGECIFSNNLDGVYMLSSVVLENASSSELESASQPYNTTPYNHTQFGAPAIFFTGTHSDTGLNTDVDPAYEYLQVSVLMNLSVGGSYLLQGVLLDSGGDSIYSQDSHANETEVLLPSTAGVVNVSLNFSGVPIYASQANGPYTVGLYVYNDSSFGAIIYSYRVGFSTNSYNYTSFEGYDASITAATESALDVNNNTLYDYIRLNVTVNVSQADTYIFNAYLLDAGGATITSTSNATSLPSGVSSVIMYFDGRDIRNKTKNGPYNITCAMYNSRQQLVSMLKIVSSSYTYTSFDAYGGDYFSITYSDHGTDSDSDGIYDFLTLDMNASTNLNADYTTYQLVMSLYDQNGSFVTQAGVNASLNNQSKPVQMNFTGQQIWARKIMNGTYNITLDAYSYSGNGTLAAELADAYKTSPYNYTQFKSKTSEFTGTYSDSGIDTDSDSLYNYLRINVNTNVLENGTYSLTGYLYDGNGTYLLTGQNETTLTVGTRTISLYFDGLEIHSHGVNGTYALKNLALYKNGTQADSRESAYTTSSYRYTQFQMNQVTLTGNYSGYGLDTNNNSKYDYLLIDVGVNVMNSGTYAINARLVDNMSREIVWSSNSSYLYNNQTNTLQVRFSGRSIYGSLVNGPYHLNDLHIYNTGATTQSVKAHSAYATPPYNYTDFEVAGVIEGFVKNVSGSPVAYAIVSLHSGDSDVSNSSGHYKVIISSTGQYTMEVSPPYGSDYVDNSTTVSASIGNITQVNITLPNQAVLLVSVFNESGSPINQSSVSASGTTSAGSNKTNSNGGCRIDKLKGGSYTLTTTPPNGPNLLTDTTRLNLSYGENRIINITLLTGGIITGNITDVYGNPIYNAYVYLYSGPSSGGAYTNASGVYYIQRLLNGTYNVSVTPPYGANLKTNNTLVNVTKGVASTINLMLPPLPEIYINSNLILNGSVYNLEDPDGDGAIILNASNVVLDCNGSVINGTRVGYGIYIPSGKTNFTVKNCVIENYDEGIYIYYSSNNLIENNTITRNAGHGLYLYASNYNTLRSNNISANHDYGIYMYSSDYLTVSSNDIRSNAYGVYIYYSDDSNLSSNNIYNNTQYGLYMYYSRYNNLTNNAMQSNRINLWLYDSSGFSYYNHSIDATNTVGGQSIYYYFNQTGTVENQNAGHIGLAYSNAMTVRNNNISGGDGIILYSSTYNNLQNNTVSASAYGAYMDYYSTGNTLTDNTFCSNSQYDIYASSSSCGTGVRNTCNNPSYYWNDNSTTDCTYRCGAGSGISLALSAGWNLMSLPLNM